MDIDSVEQDSQELNSDFDDMGSELTEEAESPVSLPTRIHELVVPTVKTLAQLVKNFPNVPAQQQKAWAKIWKVDPHQLSLRGFNSTNVRGRVDAIQATIFFVPEDEWHEELNRLLEDLTEGDDAAIAFSHKSRERLFTVYPHLRNNDIGKLTPNKLLRDPVVNNRLGKTFKLHPTDPENFMGDLEEYLSSSSGSTTAVLWPLVQRVEIHGRFSVLSSGIVLVDLPGHGDDNDIRNNVAAEFIKQVDGVILVVDSKRAQNDRIDLFRFGWSFGGCLMLAVTGTDTSIQDNEVKVNEDNRKKLAKLAKQLKEMRQLLIPSKKSKTPGKTKRRESLKLEQKIREVEQEKALLLANCRIAGIRRSMATIFSEIWSSLAPEGSETPELPVFCVGSSDYLALSSYTSTPLVFREEEETEITVLKSHLGTTGERRQMKWAARLLDNAHALSEDIHSYFSEGRHPGRLPMDNKDSALSLILELDEANREEVEDTLQTIEDEIQRVETDLKKAVAKAAEHGPRVMAEQTAGMRYSTYRALMRHEGLFLTNDLNRALTRGILPAIQSSWNGTINHKIPLALKESTEKIEERTLAAITEICKAINGDGITFHQKIATARQSLPIEGLLTEMLTQAIDTISVAQRDGTRAFCTIIRKELTPQYQRAAQESGKGALARMNTSNITYLEQNREALFNGINLRISKLLRDAFSNIRHQLRSELADITSLLRLSLVDEVNLSKDGKELKDEILHLTLENRPTFAAKRIDLADRRRSLGLE
ncbi:hypothetical protein DFH07DRAFT_1061126 [Mycena maculata]|uniref:Uncharacterized protein n=1 Tax=Mycena maculata TaxID=230809 RepID=A0AAD7J4N1_9AGAR|nr:hypothetical protein DFH07DRAFT_1061126 [Mycena maculata]